MGDNNTSLGMMLGAAAGNMGLEQLGNVMGMSRNRTMMNYNAEIQNRITAFNMEKQKELWDYTNYENQVKHLKNAGLNPGLLYGKGGGGGMTAAVNTGSVGGQAGAGTNSAGRLFDMQAILNAKAQNELLKEQAANLRADTANKQAQADLTNGPMIQKTNQEASLLAKQGKNADETFKLIREQVNEKIEQVEAAQRENRIGNATADDQIKIIQQEAIGGVLKNNLMRAQTDKTRSDIKVNDAQINKISQEIMQKWYELNQTGAKNQWEHDDRVKAIEEYTSNALKVAGIMAAGNIISDITKIATRKVPTGSRTTTTGPKGTTESHTQFY